MFRLFTNSSNIFTENKHNYELALKNCDYKAKLVYKIIDVRNRRNNRAKIILWFTPQYNMAEANKIWKIFFTLLKKTFPCQATYMECLTRTLLNQATVVCPMQQI